ncbi:methyl-accepting chemotaxis protein [Cytobacillus dafuensis]|nr:methyl-accepting chemotaxis protein [Cytobacillus dafuensis]
MKRSIISKLTWLVVIVVFGSLTLFSLTSYYMTYEKVKQAAGLELLGCANITTGLLTAEDIKLFSHINKEEADRISEKINWTIAHKPIFENQYILSLDGTVLVADQHLQKQGVNNGDSFYIDPKILQEIKKSKQPVYSDVYQFAGMKRLSGYAPIFEDHDPTKEVVAISAIDFDAEILKERTMSMVALPISVGIISLLVSGVIIVLFVRKTILPLKPLTYYTKKVAEGDLTIEIKNEKAEGEIHELQIHFNRMIESLKNSLNVTTNSSKELAAATEQLSVNAIGVTNLVEEVTASFGEVSSSVKHQAANVERVKNVFKNIGEETNEMTQQIENTTSQSIYASQKAINGEEIMNESIKQMNDIYRQTINVSSAMNELSEKSIEVGEVLNIITTISKQTNMLALNASIESARAGVHGKGFAVVSEEVRSLAEETSESVHLIRKIIAEMQIKTAEAVQVTTEGNHTVSDGMKKVEEAKAAFADIKNSIEQMSKEFQLILQHIQKINLDVQNSNIDVERINEETNAIFQSIHAVAINSQQQTAAIEEISSSIDVLLHMANDMEDIVNNYKLP